MFLKKLLGICALILGTYSFANAATAKDLTVYKLARTKSKNTVCANVKQVIVSDSIKLRRKLTSIDGVKSTFKRNAKGFVEKATIGSDSGCEFVYVQTKKAA